MAKKVTDTWTFLSPLDDDGESDIASYNKELEQRGNPKWHDVPWLYSECYLCMPILPHISRREYTTALT